MGSMKLNIFEHLPSELLNCSVSNLHDILGGPTLIHLHKEKKNPLFISVLLHGNEHSGFLVIQKIWQKLLSQEIIAQRGLIFFIGNTLAAKANQRQLNEQLDFNRVWSGGSCSMAQVAQKVLSYAKDEKVITAIDIHNNSGKNPFYACVNKSETAFIDLAYYFSEKIVYFTEPHEVLSIAFSNFCTSVTIEAGLSGAQEGIKHLVEKILPLISNKEILIKSNLVTPPIFHSIARFRVNPQSSIDFDFNPNSSHDLSLLSDLENYNFVKLPQGFVIGYIKSVDDFWLEHHFDEDFTHDYLDIKNNQIIVKREFVPAMLTHNIEVIKTDCLGYIMEYL
jgi:succinylglutamate desuccinylase